MRQRSTCVLFGFTHGYAMRLAGNATCRGLFRKAVSVVRITAGRKRICSGESLRAGARELQL